MKFKLSRVGFNNKATEIDILKGCFFLQNITKREETLLASAFRSGKPTDRVLEARKWLEGVVCIMSSKSHLDECQIILLMKRYGSPQDAKKFYENKARQIHQLAKKRATFDRDGMCTWDGYTDLDRKMLDVANGDVNAIAHFMRSCWNDSVLYRTNTEMANEARKMPIETKNADQKAKRDEHDLRHVVQQLREQEQERRRAIMEAVLESVVNDNLGYLERDMTVA